MSIFFYCWILVFQSTLPHGSDLNNELTKAKIKTISIHAPSRERHTDIFKAETRENFNPRSLAGATAADVGCRSRPGISIHAPSRERPFLFYRFQYRTLFQSTLPHGSDYVLIAARTPSSYFNPRSLTGATCRAALLPSALLISIHAPSRERLFVILTIY
mgnify:CR=1 FL=1